MGCSPRRALHRRSCDIRCESLQCCAIAELQLTVIQARVPEKLKPGAFDIWGNSHQIFHVLVVLAAAAHLVGLLKAFDYEHSHRAAIMSSYSSLRKLVPGG